MCGPVSYTHLDVYKRQALIGALIDVTLVVHLAEDLLDGLAVIVVGGADEAVVGDVHQLPDVYKRQQKKKPGFGVMNLKAGFLHNNVFLIS